MHQILSSLWACVICNRGNCRSLLFSCSQVIMSETVQPFACNEFTLPSLTLLCPVIHYISKDYILYTLLILWWK